MNKQNGVTIFNQSKGKHQVAVCHPELDLVKSDVAGGRGVVGGRKGFFIQLQVLAQQDGQFWWAHESLVRDMG